MHILTDYSGLVINWISTLEGEADKRQGVCVGLSEILTSTSREMVMSFVDSLVPTVRLSLCDPDREVRVAAAKTFDALHTTVGSKALDDILPHMLQQLSDPELHDNTLDGLRQVINMSILYGKSLC